MSGKINGVHHIALKPTKANYKKTMHFYTELLGLEVKRTWGDPEFPCAMVSCGDNSCLEILPQENDFTQPEVGPLAHLAFATADVDELIEAVRADGYEIKIEPFDTDLNGAPIHVAFCYGPTGEEIEFFWEK